jgi:Helix-turn-helix domain
MLVNRAYKTELDLNDRQVTACKQHAGAARWAHNWGLTLKQELHRELNVLKHADVPWMYDVSKCAPQEALRNLDAAFHQLLPPMCPQEAGEVEREAGVSSAVAGSMRISRSRRARSTANSVIWCWTEI